MLYCYRQLLRSLKYTANSGELGELSGVEKAPIKEKESEKERRRGRMEQKPAERMERRIGAV